MKVDAVVLGGGDGAVIDPACRFKGLLSIAGRPMIEWVVDALRSSETVGCIAVVVPTAEDLGPWVDKVDKLVVSDGSFMDNVSRGVASFRVDRPVLVTTGDLPTLTAEAVDEFVEASLMSGAEVTAPLISKQDMLAQFPGAKRTFVKLATGEYTVGNMTLVVPRLVEGNRSVGQRLFESRKSPAAMVRILGFRFVLRFLTGRLDPADVALKLQDIFGGTAAAIVTSAGSIGADVDKPVDVEVAERVLRRTTPPQ